MAKKKKKKNDAYLYRKKVHLLIKLVRIYILFLPAKLFSYQIWKPTDPTLLTVCGKTDKKRDKQIVFGTATASLS